MQLTDQQIKQILIAVAIKDMLDTYDVSELYGYTKGINKLLSILGYEPSDIIDNLYTAHCNPLSMILFDQKISRDERLRLIHEYFEKIDVSSINKINS